jgi:hypothetical protein
MKREEVGVHLVFYTPEPIPPTRTRLCNPNFDEITSDEKTIGSRDRVAGVPHQFDEE